MNWNSAAEFFAMGGYGLYVWGSFGVTALVIAGEMLSLRSRRKALLAAEPEPDYQPDYREGAA
jgi:heme exporter protein D